jgi:electron transfer flavoprotein beta subunit
MSTVYACYKWVIDEKDIRIEGTTADLSRAAYKIGDYDLNAIEAASQLSRELDDGIAKGLTLGGFAAKASLKDALSRGLDEVCWINSSDTQLVDHRITAKALAAVIKADKDAVCVVCAEGSQDLFARQTAPRIAALLGWPLVTTAIAVSYADDRLSAVRRLEDCLESVSVELPVVISVLPEINTPEHPKLKAIMGASKKPIQEVSLDELAVDVSEGMAKPTDTGYVSRRKNIVITEGAPTEKAAALLDYLKKEGVL